MVFTTKPKGIHATFETQHECGDPLTITNGRIDPHECPRYTGTLDDIRAALERRNPRNLEDF